MKFDSRYVEDKLRQAEFDEISSSESHLFGDLREQLGDGRLEAGVTIEFGDQKPQLEAVLGQLGITGLLWQRSSFLHIHNVVVVSGGRKSFLGKSLSDIRNTPILDVLDAVQSDHWTTDDEHGMYPRIQPAADVIVSKAVLVNTAYVDGEKRADPDLMGLVIGVANRYRPNFNHRRQHLPYFVRDNEKANGSFPRDVVGGMVAEMTVNNLRVDMPQRSYYLKLGPLVANAHMPTIEDVATDHSLKVVAGRVERAEK